MTETRIETYIPLYRKYRPQTFADLVGQEAVAQTLGNAIRLNKVAHAYLFCGPRGTGKTSTARIFGKSLNCEQGPTVTPCLQCASCTGIAQGNALDVIEFDAASNNGVDDARELIENCQYSSMTGRFKVYIIDEVHMLTPQAFNALLKTLEEPPANVIFIFATTEAHKVLPTIISRCQRFDFNRITTDNIVSRLRYIAEQEQIAIDEEALLAIGRHARGGLRDAVGLLDQVSVLSRAQQDKVVGRKDVALFIGTLEEDLLLRLGSAIAERRSADLLNDLSELLSRGIEPVQLLKDLTMHFRNLLLVQASGAQATAEQLGFAGDHYQKLAEQAKLFPEPEEIPQIIGRLAFVERNVRNSSQAPLWLEVGLIELTYRYEINLVKDLAERITALEARLATGAPVPSPLKQAPAPQPARSAPPSSPAPSKTSVAPPPPAAPASASVPHAPAAPAPKASGAPQPQAGDATLTVSFTQICNSVASLTTRALLQQQAFPISLENDLLVIGCASEPTLSLLKKPDKLIHLQKAVDKFYGRPLRLELVLEKRQNLNAATPPAGASPPPQKPLAQAAPPPPPEPPAAKAPDALPFIPEAPADWMPDFPEEEPEAQDDDEEDEGEDHPVAAEPALTLGNPATSISDPELTEAKKHAVELLQGRILE